MTVTQTVHNFKQ